MSVIWQKSSASKVPAPLASVFPTAVYMAGKSSQKTVHEGNAWGSKCTLGSTSEVAQDGDASQLLYDEDIKKLEKGCLNVLFILL